MAAVILRDFWCEDATAGDYAPGFWRALARLEKAMMDGHLRPVRVLTFDKAAQGDVIFADATIECEPGRGDKPFWKWWFENETAMSRAV